jgi:hypothetical protein
MIPREKRSGLFLQKNQEQIKYIFMTLTPVACTIKVLGP